MKKILITLLMCLPIAAIAQNDWEVPEEMTPADGASANPNEKYLAGAVPVIDGKVTFEKVIAAPGKSAAEIYNLLFDYTSRMTKGGNQFEQSRIVMQDEDKHKFAAEFLEWLVFSNNMLGLDRTRLHYLMIVECQDGQAIVNISRIRYLYDEFRNPQRYTAEEWITDEVCLNKKKTKLLPKNGKFRRKTIDRMNYIFSKFEATVK